MMKIMSWSANKSMDASQISSTSSCNLRRSQSRMIAGKAKLLTPFGECLVCVGDDPKWEMVAMLWEVQSHLVLLSSALPTSRIELSEGESERIEFVGFMNAANGASRGGL